MSAGNQDNSIFWKGRGTGDRAPRLEGSVEPRGSLADFIWFRTGGPAEWLVRPNDVEDLARFLRELDPGGAGAAGRRGLEPHRPRRRRPGRGGAAAQGDVPRPYRARQPGPRRRRGDGDHRRLEGARRPYRRPRIPARHSRHGGRRGADERRRLWPRGRRHPRRGDFGASRRAGRDLAGGAARLHLSPQRGARRRGGGRGAVRGRAGRTRR